MDATWNPVGGLVNDREGSSVGAQQVLPATNHVRWAGNLDVGQIASAVHADFRTLPFWMFFITRSIDESVMVESKHPLTARTTNCELRFFGTRIFDMSAAPLTVGAIPSNASQPFARKKTVFA